MNTANKRRSLHAGQATSFNVRSGIALLAMLSASTLGDVKVYLRAELRSDRRVSLKHCARQKGMQQLKYIM